MHLKQKPEESACVFSPLGSSGENERILTKVKMPDKIKQGNKKSLGKLKKAQTRASRLPQATLSPRALAPTTPTLLHAASHPAQALSLPTVVVPCRPWKHFPAESLDRDPAS